MTVYIKKNTDVGAPTLTGAAGSLISVLDYCLVTTAGWVKEYTGTNTAAYRATSGNRMYLGVDNSTTLNARWRGFETMSAAGVAVASGTGPFPTDAQFSGGVYAYVSSDTSTARAWVFVGDAKCFYFSSQTGGTNTTQSLLFFGEFESYKAGDAYNTMLMGEQSPGSVSTAQYLVSTATATSAAHYLPRAFTQIGGSTACGKVSDTARSLSSSYLGGGGVSYPSLLDGGLLMGEVFVTEATGGIRGRLPGLWNPLHVKPLTNDDTFAGSGALAGRSFLVRNVGGSYQAFLETSDTWYA